MLQISIGEESGQAACIGSGEYGRTMRAGRQHTRQGERHALEGAGISLPACGMLRIDNHAGTVPYLSGLPVKKCAQRAERPTAHTLTAALVHTALDRCLY